MKYLCLLLVMMITQHAHAACTAPPAEAGVMIFNADHKVMQYCNGTVWVGMGGGGGTSGESTPAGAVVAFNLTACPSGWSEYTPARGRFIRGIDNGAGNDPSGTRAPGHVQADALQTHQHSFDYAASAENVGIYLNPTRIVRAKGNDHSFASGVIGGQQVANARTADETRPKNVALLYCQKS